MKSKAAAGAVRKALAEITGCADAKKLLINEKTAAYFRSGICEGDLVPGDVDALIATVKCMLQGWDACCDQQSSVALWPALCFQLTGWMCAAVRLFGDEEALARAMKNLQFSVSKGNKAEQNESVSFMLKCAALLVSARRDGLVAAGSAAGKPVALLAQGAAQFMSRNAPKIAAGADNCDIDTNIIDIFIPFVLQQETVELIRGGLEASAAGQILNYLADSTVVYLAAASAARPPSPAELSSKKKKAGKDPCGDISAAVCSVATFMASNSSLVTSPRALEWALKLARQPSVGSGGELSLQFLDVFVACLARSPRAAAAVSADVFELLVALLFTVSSSAIGQEGASKELKGLASSWAAVSELSTETPLADVAAVVATLKPLFESDCKGLMDPPLSEALINLTLSSLTGGPGVEAVASAICLVCALSVAGLGGQCEAWLVSETIEAITALVTETDALSPVLSAVVSRYSVVLRMLTPCYKLLSTGGGREVPAAAAAIYSTLLGAGYSLLANLIRASTCPESSKASDAKALSSLSALIARWKSVLSYSISRAPTAVYQLSDLRGGVVHGVSEFVWSVGDSLCKCSLAENAAALCTVDEVLSLVHAVLARKCVYIISTGGYAVAVGSIVAWDQTTSASVAPTTTKSKKKGQEEAHAACDATRVAILAREVDAVIYAVVGTYRLCTDPMDSGMLSARQKLNDIVAVCILNRVALSSLLSVDNSKPDFLSIILSDHDVGGKTLGTLFNYIETLTADVKDEIAVLLLDETVHSPNYMHDIMRLKILGGVNFAAITGLGLKALFQCLSTENTNSIEKFSNVCVCTLISEWYNIGDIENGTPFPNDRAGGWSELVNWAVAGAVDNIRLATPCTESGTKKMKSKIKRTQFVCSAEQCFLQIASFVACIGVERSTASAVDSSGMLKNIMESVEGLLSSSDRDTSMKTAPVRLCTAGAISLFHYLAVNGFFTYMDALVRLCGVLDMTEQGFDLNSLLSTQLMYNGLCAPEMPCIKNESICILLTLTKSLLGLVSPGARVNISPVFTTLHDVLNSSDDAPPVAATEYMAAVERALDSLLTSVDTKDDLSLDLNKFVGSWLCLLAAKCVMCCYSQHDMAIALTKRALKGIDLSGPTRCKNCAAVLVRFESMLLVGELYEQLGLVDRALPYLADAKAVARTHTMQKAEDDSSFLSLVYNTHILRVWHRLGSSRYSEALGVLKAATSKKDATINDRHLLRGVYEYIDTILTDSESDLNDLRINSFRLVWWQFDLFHTNMSRFHTSVRPSLRSQINSCLTAPLDEQNQEIDVAHVASKCTGIFDVLRALRRRMCVAAIFDKNGESFTPFYFSAMSCATSLFPNREAVIEVTPDCGGTPGSCAERASLSSVDFNFVSTKDSRMMTSIRDHTERLLVGFAEVLGAVDTGDADAKHRSSSRRAVVLNSLVLDRSSSTLVVSRFDVLFGPLTVAVPLSDELNRLLLNWEELTTRNVQQLTVTLSAEDVAKWTAKDKKKWWDDRSQLDDDMESFSSQLIEILGAWRCLLSGTVTDKYGSQYSVLKNADSVVSSTDLAPVFTPCDAATSNTVSKSRGNKKSSPQPGQCGDSVDELQSWIRLLLCSLTPSWLRVPLTAAECCKALLQIFSRTSEVTVCPQHVSRYSHEKNDVEEMIRDMVDRFLALESVSTGSSGKEEAPEYIDPVEPPNYQGFTVAELRAALKALSMPVSGKKADLIARLQEVDAKGGSSGPLVGDSIEKPPVSTDDNAGPGDISTYNVHTILILDESLQALPWENTPVLLNRGCSRVPNLSVLFALGSGVRDSVTWEDPGTGIVSALRALDLNMDANTLVDSEVDTKVDKNLGNVGSENATQVGQRKGADAKNRLIQAKPIFLNPKRESCWYCIDPDGNLPRTRGTMSAFLKPIAEMHSWTGVIGERIPEEAVRNLHAEHSLFIYSGHGAGEKLLHSQSFRKISSCPAAFLWGCSSGKLHMQGVHDPSGTVLNYLMSGSKFVVANLWDVTDVDIDKLSMKCMSTLLVAGCAATGHVSTALVESRSACKLKCAVGFAPVMYGVPTLLK